MTSAEGAIGMRGPASSMVGYCLVVLHSLLISVGIVLVGWMLCAAVAFGGGTTIAIPFIATFRGAAGREYAPAVTITGSVGATALLIVALAALITLLVIGAARLRYPHGSDA
ncbi:hypothetical protein ACNPM4_11115 [Microbacterium sp. AGC62]